MSRSYSQSYWFSAAYRTVLKLLSVALGGWTQPCSFLYTSFITIPLFPILRNPPLPKVYTPAKPTFTLHSLDFLLHGFSHAALSTEQALCLLRICGNPTHPAERQLSKIITNIYFRARLPGFKSQVCRLRVVWPWANYLTCLCLSCLTRKIAQKWNLCKVYGRVPSKHCMYTLVYTHIPPTVIICWF